MLNVCEHWLPYVHVDYLRYDQTPHPSYLIYLIHLVLHHTQSYLLPDIYMQVSHPTYAIKFQPWHLMWDIYDKTASDRRHLWCSLCSSEESSEGIYQSSPTGSSSLSTPRQCPSSDRLTLARWRRPSWQMVRLWTWWGHTDDTVEGLARWYLMFCITPKTEVFTGQTWLGKAPPLLINSRVFYHDWSVSSSLAHQQTSARPLMTPDWAICSISHI